MVGGVQYPKRSDLESVLSPIIQSNQTLFVENAEVSQDSLPYSINDISTWIKDQPTSSKGEIASKSPVRELHNDLDDALAKLQQILANNFTLDGRFGGNWTAD